MLKILGRPTSINVRKVLWTASEIGLAFEHQAQWATPAAPSGSPELLRLNPNGLVPVIEDENGPLWESNTICRYLAGKHGRADLLPADPAPRARVELWMDWQASELNKAWSYAFMALIRKDPGFAEAAQVERSFAACTGRLAMIADQLDASGGYMAGGGFTLADVCIGLSVHRIRSLPGGPPLPPAVERYMARLGERPAFTPYGGPQTP